MIEDFFDHKCDIFHLQETTAEGDYGLPGKPVFSYPDVPDISDVSCHFGVKNQRVIVVQGEPQQDLDARIKLTLPAGTDVRLNDKIISKTTGYEYRAEVPRDIRGHHTTVYVNRQEGKKAL